MTPQGNPPHELNDLLLASDRLLDGAKVEHFTVLTAEDQQEAKRLAPQVMVEAFDHIYATIESLKSAISSFQHAGMFKQAQQLEGCLKIQRMEAATINCLLSEQVEEQAVAL